MESRDHKTYRTAKSNSIQMEQLMVTFFSKHVFLEESILYFYENGTFIN